MEVLFYTRALKPFGKEITFNWAKLLLKENDITDEFEEDANSFNMIVDRKIKGKAVFERAECDFKSYAPYEEVIDDIANLLAKENEVIFICEFDYFREVINSTEWDENEVKFVLTKNGTMLHYVSIGEDNCVLLVSCLK